jgi:transposase
VTAATGLITIKTPTGNAKSPSKFSRLSFAWFATQARHGRADTGIMLDRDEFVSPPGDRTMLRSELESLRRQLVESRARNLIWRSVIERHLSRGCPSQTLRALLAEPEQSGDDAPGRA